MSRRGPPLKVPGKRQVAIVTLVVVEGAALGVSVRFAVGACVGEAVVVVVAAVRAADTRRRPQQLRCARARSRQNAGQCSRPLLSVHECAHSAPRTMPALTEPLRHSRTCEPAALRTVATPPSRMSLEATATASRRTAAASPAGCTTPRPSTSACTCGVHASPSKSTSALLFHSSVSPDIAAVRCARSSRAAQSHMEAAAAPYTITPMREGRTQRLQLPASCSSSQHARPSPALMASPALEASGRCAIRSAAIALVTAR